MTSQNRKAHLGVQPQGRSSSQAEPEACQDLQKFGANLGPCNIIQGPIPNRRWQMLTWPQCWADLWGFIISLHKYWKQATSQPLLLSHVEWEISANYLQGYFHLLAFKAKIRRCSEKCSWRRTEGELPLWPRVTGLIPALTQHNRNQHLTCTSSGPRSSIHLKPTANNRSWPLIEKILWHYPGFWSELGWAHACPRMSQSTSFQ